MILSPRWWAAAIDRAIRTAAQTALATLGADQLDVLAADWPAVGSLAAGCRAPVDPHVYRLPPARG